MPTIQSVRIIPVSFRLTNPFVAEASSSIAMPGETQANMQHALKSLVPEVREKDIRDYRTLIQTCWRKQPYHPTAVAALESALLDAYTRTTGQPLYKFFGGKKT